MREHRRSAKYGVSRNPKGRPQLIDVGRVKELYAQKGATKTCRELNISRSSVYRIVPKNQRHATRQ